MNFLYKLFLEHPKKENMTYFQHFRRAIYFSFKLSQATICLLIHGLFPKYFEYTGSNIIKQIYQEINKRKV
jgi:hypothetical protein